MPTQALESGPKDDITHAHYRTHAHIQKHARTLVCTHLFQCIEAVVHGLATSLLSKPFGLFLLAKIFQRDQAFRLHLVQHKSGELQNPLPYALCFPRQAQPKRYMSTHGVWTLTHSTAPEDQRQIAMRCIRTALCLHHSLNSVNVMR